MKERQIIFSGAMVRALLAGIKTQTRRVVKFRRGDQIEERDDGALWPWMYDEENDSDSWLRCPYGRAGDRLWVRETWAYHVQAQAAPRDEDSPLVYAADGQQAHQMRLCDRWRSPIHMPRWASRITLEVAGVRVERLQDISTADALAEGVSVHKDHHNKPRTSIYSPVQAYRDLYESINGADSWDFNPWVWVVEFKRTHP